MRTTRSSPSGSLCPGRTEPPPPAETPLPGHRLPSLDRDTPDREPPGQRPPRRSMGPGSQTGSDIIQRPQRTEWHTLLQILPCPRLHLWVVIIQYQPEFSIFRGMILFTFSLIISARLDKIWLIYQKWYVNAHYVMHLLLSVTKQE